MFVQKADLIQDRDIIVNLHQRFLAPNFPGKRFDWLYCQNPCGSPMVWIARDEGSGEAIGTAAAFPRFLWVGTKKEIGWVLGDFCVSDAYRSLGPALQLQRTCLEGVGVGENSIWYDFPSLKMLAIYRRLKILPSGKMVRFVKPMHIDRRIRSWVKVGIIQKSIAGLGNWVLKWSTKNPKVREGLTFHAQTKECGKEFTELSERISGNLGNCLERSAAYLNWRYYQNPVFSCEMVTARYSGQLKGYIIFADMEDAPSILDMFSSDEEDIVLGLIHQVIDRVRERGRESLSVSMVEGHIWIPYFETFGFKARDTNPVIIQNPLLVHEQASTGTGHASLLLMQGDRDA